MWASSCTLWITLGSLELSNEVWVPTLYNSDGKGADAAAENGFSSEIFGFGFVCKSIGTLWAKKGSKSGGKFHTSYKSINIMQK